MSADVRAGVPAQPGAPAAEQLPDGTAAARESFDLVQAAQAGDVDAFAQLYTRYLPMVFGYVRARVGHRETAEDLTADTFLRAWRRIGFFTWQGRDPGAWFVTIARNLVIDYCTSGRYRCEVVASDELYPRDVPDRSAEGAPDETVLQGLDAETVLTALMHLRPLQREVLLLRFFRGLSVTETAHAMGRNEGAVKALQYRAVRSIRPFLPTDIREPK